MYDSDSGNSLDVEVSTQIEHAEVDGTERVQSNEVVIGTLVGIDDNGQPLVSYDCIEHYVNQLALSTVDVETKHLGRQTALLFANGDPSRPIILGFTHSPLHGILDNVSFEQSDELESTVSLPDEVEAAPQEMLVDGKKVLIEGKEEIVLRCGESSITLTKAGKILIRGKYLLNRSSGVNRIMGGSVQVN